MNFSGIITPNCSVKDLPFHQIAAAAEKLQEREIRAKSHLLALTAIKAFANHKLLFFFKQTQNYWRRANFFLIFLNLKCLELSLQVASINLDWETKNYSQHWQTPLIYLFIYRLRMQFYRDFKCLFPLSKSIIKLLKLDQRSCPKGLSIESMTGSTSTIQSTGRMAQSHHSRKWVVFFSSLYKCI